MKKSLLVVGLFLSAVCLGGCLVIVSEERKGPERPPVCLPADETIAEIDAVGKLSFDQNRQEGYKRIAEREGLSEGAQVYLVEAILDKLSFDNAKEDLLLTLINNPSFSSAGKQAILEGLDKLAFENTKQKILKAISERETLGRTQG